MKKIIYIPLDERPCNYLFPQLISKGTDNELVVPPFEILGDKKKPANIDRLWHWIFENIEDANAAILSIDMLIYGGIIPSRLHDYSEEECRVNLNKFRKLKEINKNIKLYGFNLIMRCPRYSSDDEEPDYYKDFGKEIFTNGYLQHKARLNLITKQEEVELNKIEEIIPAAVLEDYISRRNINNKVNKAVIDLVKEEVFDFMVIPQDDSAPYGYTAVDQHNLRQYISKEGLDLKVYMYPGADEVGCTLLARMINEFKREKPSIYIKYSSQNGPFCTPLYEDRPLFETLKYHILCSGGVIASSLSEADMVIMVNTPGKEMVEASTQHNKPLTYSVERNLVEFVEYMDYVINYKKKPCIVADVAFANGADLQLINLMKQKELLFSVAGYAGWNTNSNTIGTCVSQGTVYNIYGDTKNHLDFLALRYVEDAGYCAHVRSKVTEEILPDMGLNYFMVDGKHGKVSKIVKEELQNYINDNLVYNDYNILINNCYMPWKRMFEVGLEVEVTGVNI